MSRERTDGVTLPASTSLSVAGAVHHVALIVDFGEFLVYFIGQAINNALICRRKENKLRLYNMTTVTTSASKRL